MTVSDADLTRLAAGHDIITLGMHADEARRVRHGAKTTFLRVAEVSAEPGSPIVVASAAREIRVTGTPASRDAAIARVREVAAASRGIPVAAFSLADLESRSGGRASADTAGLLSQARASHRAARENLSRDHVDRAWESARATFRLLWNAHQGLPGRGSSRRNR